MDPFHDMMWLPKVTFDLKWYLDRIKDSVLAGTIVIDAAEKDIRQMKRMVDAMVERIDRDRAAEQGERPARAA